MVYITEDNSQMEAAEPNTLLQSHCVFPVPDIKKTARYYSDMLGFRAVEYLDVKEPHICLYRDDTEIILLQANTDRVHPNRELYGYGEDAYFITRHPQEMYDELAGKGVQIVRPLTLTDYNNYEFIIEDIDGRHIAFGIKQG